MGGDLRLKGYQDYINEFIKDCKDLIIYLKQFKKQIKIIVPIKEQEVAYYKNFVDFLIKYEEINTKSCKNTEIGDQFMNVQLVICESRNINMREKLQAMVIYLNWFNYMN